MAIDEIEELGASLLQRQRTTRKRKQKRVDKDKRNAMWLQVAGQGLSLTNTVLRNRADNFVNTTEEFVGQRLLYGVGLKDRDYIISEYEKASQTPGGVEAYLTEQYKIPIQNSLNRQFDMDKWDKDDQDTYVFSEALKAAKEFAPKFEAGYQNALSMPDIGDYDAYIKSKDGRSENVGGFIFNKLSRMFNDRTQEDVDADLINEVSNSRYADSAAQMKTFRQALDAGYNTLEANAFAKSTPSDLKMQPAGIIVEELNRVTLDYEEFGDPKKIEVIEVISTVNGKKHLSLRPFVQEDNEGNPILDENGNQIPVSPEAWKRFNMYRNGLPLNNEGDVDGVSFETQPLLLVRDSEGRAVTGHGIFNERGREFQDYFKEFFGGAVRSLGIPYFIPDSPLTLVDMQANLPPGVRETQAGLIRDAASQFRINGKTAHQVGTAGLWAISASTGVRDFEKLEDNDRGNIQDSHVKNIEVASAIKAMELSARYMIPLEQTQILAAWQYLTSVATGYDIDEKTYRLNENFISVAEFPATTALAADSRIEADAPGLNVEIPPFSYAMMTVEAMAELDTPADASESDKVHLQIARDLLKQSNYFMSQYVNFSILDEAEDPNQIKAIQDIKDALNGSGIQPDENNNVSMVNIMRHLDGLGGIKDDKDITSELYSYTNLSEAREELARISAIRREEVLAREEGFSRRPSVYARGMGFALGRGRKPGARETFPELISELGQAVNEIRADIKSMEEEEKTQGLEARMAARRAEISPPK